MADFDIQFSKDYRLTTAQIYYHMPDYPKFLQEFVWQEYDLAPKYPVLTRFLDFWVEKIEGKLHSVYVARQKIICAGETRHYDCQLDIN